MPSPTRARTGAPPGRQRGESDGTRCRGAHQTHPNPPHRYGGSCPRQNHGQDHTGQLTDHHRQRGSAAACGCGERDVRHDRDQAGDCGRDPEIADVPGDRAGHRGDGEQAHAHRSDEAQPQSRKRWGVGDSAHPSQGLGCHEAHRNNSQRYPNCDSSSVLCDPSECSRTLTETECQGMPGELEPHDDEETDRTEAHGDREEADLGGPCRRQQDCPVDEVAQPGHGEGRHKG